MDSIKHKENLGKIATRCLKAEIQRQIDLAKQHAVPTGKFTPEERNKCAHIILGSYHQGRLEALESIMDYVVV
jgi:hypothetical protein